MGALRSMSNLLGYSEEVSGEYEDNYTTGEATYEDEFVDEGHFEAVRTEEAVTAPDLRRIVTVHPPTYNEARVIGEAFRSGVPVIINLTNMNEGDARRMVDFSAGLVFGLEGAIERVTPRVFLLTPATVEIDGGEEAPGADSRFFNQG